MRSESHKANILNPDFTQAGIGVIRANYIGDVFVVVQSFITPSGLGFREGAIVGLFALAFPLPGALAAIMALLSRFVSTVAELLCVSIAYVSGGRPPRALEQAQAQTEPERAPDATAKTEPTTEETISDAAVEEPSDNIPLENKL